jgi:endonuclease III
VALKTSSAKFRRRAERVSAILPILKRTYPDAHCRLDHTSPLELLVATILSAQCTDDRVNIVTKDLFARYRKAADYAKASQEQIERAIQSTGFFRNKARSIRGMAAALLEKHGGEVPRTMEELIALPGVGRKTANVVLGNAFHQNVGIVVDTHVTRVSNRLGLTDHATDAAKIEHDLMPLVPQDDWCLWSHLLIYHGRALCTARNPKCEACPILQFCPFGARKVREAANQGTRVIKTSAKGKPRRGR